MGRRIEMKKNERFGKLLVIDEAAVRINKIIHVRVLCDCGNQKLVVRKNLTAGKSKTCGECAVYDSINKKFGKLLAIRVRNKNDLGTIMECKCDCGSTRNILLQDLRRKKGLETRSCGKCHDHKYIGKKFNKLTIVECLPSENKHRMCRAECECGNTIDRPTRLITNEKIKSCGCIKITHNKTGHELYSVWTGLKTRCLNKNNHNYHSYGGRGITVCDRWLNGENNMAAFDCFISDMGSRPEGYSLDRIDVNKGYSPDNCRWASSKTQATNKRKKVYKTDFDSLKEQNRKLKESIEYYKKEYQLILEDNERIKSLIYI